MSSVSLAGRTTSHYTIVEEISRGGRGVVYRATDARLNRDVALKVLPAELTTDGLAFRLFMPVEYVFSLYHLGQIADRRGDKVKACECYGRFLQYWKDGDLDRDHVQEAMRQLQ